MAARVDEHTAPPAWAAAAAARVEAWTALASVLLGIYLLIMTGVYAWTFRNPFIVSFPLASASLGTAYAAHIFNIAIIYGLFVKKFLGCHRDLFYALSGSLALSMVTAPVTLLTLICAIASKQYDVALWEMARFGFVLFHLSLVRRFIRNLRGKRFVNKACSTPTMSSTPPSPTPSPLPTPPSLPTPPPLPTTPPPSTSPTLAAPPKEPPT